MEKYLSQDSLATLFSEDSAYLSDGCQCHCGIRTSPNVKELNSKIDNLIQEMTSLKTIVNELRNPHDHTFCQETLENDVTPTLNLKETQTVTMTPTVNSCDETKSDTLNDENQNDVIQEVKLTRPPTPPSELCEDSITTISNI